MDPSTLGEEERLEHLPQSAPSRYRAHAVRDQHRSRTSQTYETYQTYQTALAAFHAYPPDSGPDVAHAQTNLTAFATNGTARSTSEKLANLADPDDFYRNYRGSPSNGLVSSIPVPIGIATATATTTATVNSSMASAVSNRPPPSPRPNANGNALKHPVLAAGRTALRPAQRSTSNPVDDRGPGIAASRTADLVGPGPASKPSVKDLKKRFDPAYAQPPASRPPPPRDSPSPAMGRSASAGLGPVSYSSLRMGTAKDAGTGTPKTDATRPMQRQRFVVEDQLSSNAQSFSSRISKPRPRVLTEPRAAKSTIPLSPIVSPRSSPATARQATGLLFGEVPPEHNGFSRPGYGIEEARPRNSSHARSRSNVEPSSPADWYRAGPGDRSKDLTPSRAKGPHLRAQSDSSSTPSLSNTSHVATKRSPMGTSATENSKSIGLSVPLRVSLKKLNTSSSQSCSSTRSNSPVKTPSHGRTSRQNGRFPVTRSKTPTHRSADSLKSSSKTPTASPRLGKKAPPANMSTPGNTRVNAHVSSVPLPLPQPKLSPTLRSSRPRQSVATATTAASRSKVVERGPVFESRADSTAESGPEVKQCDTMRRRKVSVGPIDFAQRRETIKLAYTKSIRETQAREAREAAAEARRRELAAVMRRKAEAEAEAEAEAAADLKAAVEAEAFSTQPGRESAEPVRGHSKRPSDSLKIVTDLPVRQSMIPRLSNKNSPVLGVPGSFPAFPSPGFMSPASDRDRVPAPRSALSDTTVATEFDVDAQTEPPTQVSTAATEDSRAAMMAEEGQTETHPETHPEVPRRALSRKASYRSPFDADGMSDNASIQIALQTSARPSPMRAEFQRAEYQVPSPFRNEFEGKADLTEDKAEAVVETGLAIDAGSEAEAEVEAVMPGSFQHEYAPQSYHHAATGYETTISMLGPEGNSRPSHTGPRRVSGDTREKTANEAGQSVGEGVEKPGEFHVGPTLRDNMAALRESTITLSDVDTTGDIVPSSAEFQKTPDTSHSLTVPPLMSPNNRLSQVSAWTDYSLDSSDGRDSGARSSYANLLEPEIREQSSIKSAKSAEAHVNPLRGHGLESSAAAEASLSDPCLVKHRLPELDTGACFSIPYYPAEHLRQQPGAAGNLADHEPSRLTTENHYEANEDVYAARTRPNSYLEDVDEDDLVRSTSVSTRQSTSQETAEACLSTAQSVRSGRQSSVAESTETGPGTGTGPGPGPGPGPSEKEKKRLKQRQLVIRELIDTETIFIRDMTVVEEIYKGTAEACPNLDAKTVKLIFRNSDDIIAFHTFLLAHLKEGVSSVYAPRGRKSPGLLRQDSFGKEKDSDAATINSTASHGEFSDEKDRMTMVGDAFIESIDKLKMVHEAYLRTSDQSTKRLMQMQEDPTVKVWLNECNEVAKDLTSAWNLDSLLIKPMQRITKYPDIITHLLKYTPEDHPDREALTRARAVIMEATDDINKSKKNFELVGQIVSNRKRKESDVRTGIARAFGKRVDKLQPSLQSRKMPEDDEYSKLHEKFGDDYLRLQVVLRDVEYYTRTVSTYVREFLQYLSSMELVMRLQPSKYHSHLESKWVQFNVSMRDMEKVALERHLADIRKHVIEPFEDVIRCYANPATAMRKRTKRRLDHDRFCQLKAANKKIDKQLSDLNEQYEALNETLKKELPRLSDLTATVGNICLGKFVSIQATWYRIWQDKIKMPLADGEVPEVADIVGAFQRDFKDMEDECGALAILSCSSGLRSRASQSTTDDSASVVSRSRSSRPSDMGVSAPTRARGLSVNSDSVPTLPTPDLGKRNSVGASGANGLAQSLNSGSSPFASGPLLGNSYLNYYRDHYAGISAAAQVGRGPPMSPFCAATERSVSEASSRLDNRRHSNPHPPAPSEPSSRRFSGLFHSALPLAEGGSGTGTGVGTGNGTGNGNLTTTGPDESRSTPVRYNVMYLAASLFEFHIQTTKHEAGYPYLTYQAGEIFDVIAEKGELWLAKNQDDPAGVVGWIWSKHFAQLADS